MKKLKLIFKKGFQTKKSPGPEEFTPLFYQPFKDLQVIFLILFKDIEEALLNSFYEVNINLIAKSGKDSTEKNSTGQQPDEHRIKKLLIINLQTEYRHTL